MLSYNYGWQQNNWSVGWRTAKPDKKIRELLALKSAFDLSCQMRESKANYSSGENMTDRKPTDPLHGVTLEMILTELVEYYGWEEMGRTVRIKCFTNDPSIKSSLQFLRRTPWARNKVEALNLRYKREIAKKPKIT